jgi:hypothetical protein
MEAVTAAQFATKPLSILTEPQSAIAPTARSDERASLIPRKQKWCASALAWTENLADLERRQAE